MIELRTLGGVELRATASRDPVAIAAHPKPLALLAYLAAARPFGAHRRDSLVGLLWPELDQEHARGALRKTLHRVRHVVGADAIVASGDETLGIAESVLWCDVRAFDEAARTDRAAEALALYRGDFLPGLFVAAAPEFERWRDGARQELRACAVRMAWRAADHAERGSDAAEAARWARHAIRLVPDDEQGVRRLISLLDRVADRAGAIRAYEQFERYLVTELQVAPSAETAAVIAGVRSRASPSVRAFTTIAPPFASGSQPRATPGALSPGALSPAAAPAFRGAPRRLVVIVLGTIAIAATLLAVGPSSRRPVPVGALDDAQVAVLALENETGRRELDFVGLEVQDWVTRGLQTTGLVRAFPVPSGVTATGSAAKADASDEDERRWAMERGVGTIIRGRYYARRDSILLQVSIVDVGTGEAIATLDPVVAPVGDPTAAIEMLRRRTLGVLATHLDPALSQWARSASRPPSFEAYRAFSEGREAFDRDDYPGAIAQYLRASAIDTGYVYPQVMAARLQLQGLNAKAAADSLLRAVRSRYPHLAPFDDALAGEIEGLVAGDFERTFDEAQRLRRYAAPGSDWELDAVAAAVALNRPRDAMAIVKSVDLHRPPALDHWDVFVPIINAHHLAGEDAALLTLLRRDAGKWEQAPIVVIGQMVALAALSRPAEVAPLWRTLLRTRDDTVLALASEAALVGARELRSHGSGDAARSLALEALDSIRTIEARSPQHPPPRAPLGLLREAGRDKEAWSIVRARLAAQPRSLAVTGTTAAVAARMGDTTTARALAARLARWPFAADRRDLLVTRARVAAALGDRNTAVALLHAACDHGCAPFEDLHSYLEFDALRSYPPFQELLRPARER